MENSKLYFRNTVEYKNYLVFRLFYYFCLALFSIFCLLMILFVIILFRDILSLLIFLSIAIIILVIAVQMCLIPLHNICNKGKHARETYNHYKQMIVDVSKVIKTGFCFKRFDIDLIIDGRKIHVYSHLYWKKYVNSNRLMIGYNNQSRDIIIIKSLYDHRQNIDDIDFA